MHSKVLRSNWSRLAYTAIATVIDTTTLARSKVSIELKFVAAIAVDPNALLVKQ